MKAWNNAYALVCVVAGLACGGGVRTGDEAEAQPQEPGHILCVEDSACAVAGAVCVVGFCQVPSPPSCPAACLDEEACIQGACQRKGGAGCIQASDCPGQGALCLDGICQLPPELSPGVEVVLSMLSLTPMEAAYYSERHTAFSISAHGLEDEADAQLHLEEVAGLSLTTHSHFQNGSKTFTVAVEYDGHTPFPEGSAAIHFGLHTPANGHGGMQTLHVGIVDGKAPERRIPIHRVNLFAFNAYANTGEGLRRHYRLEEDIELALGAQEAGNWTPIGTYEAPFTGSFDGGGNTLIGLVVHAPQENYVGMFGRLHGKGAHIANLGLLGGRVSGGDYIGGLVGANSGGRIETSYSTSDIAGSHHIGGLVGANEDGTLDNSYATGNVSGTQNVGGLVGWNASGTLDNSYAAGEVSASTHVGGLVGANEGTIQNCVALNAQVVAAGIGAGRVAGAALGTLSNNYAWADMRLCEDGGCSTTANTTNADNKHGLSTTFSGEEAFWTSALPWNFAHIWQWSTASKLPILNHIRMLQNHTAP